MNWRKICNCLKRNPGRLSILCLDWLKCLVIIFFGTYLAAFRSILLIAGSKLWPTYISSTLSKRSVLILEDLTPLGYKMFQRHIGFDLNHCLLALKTISKFHAASLVVHTYVIIILQNRIYSFVNIKLQEPKLIGSYKEGLYSEKETITAWIKQGFEAMIKATLTWPGR